MLRVSSLFGKLFGNPVASGDMARRRLQLVLVHDRTGLTYETMETMKQSLLEVVSKYLIIDKTSAQIEVRRTGEFVLLASNMVVMDVARGSTATVSQN